MVLVAVGLFCVWLGIGRRWRFLNVYLNPRTSWMSREAYAAVPFFGLGGLAWFTGSLWLGVLAAICGLFFLYCQARILRAAKGIPAWRQPGIVPLILTTGLTEGLGLLAIVSALSGAGAELLRGIAVGLMVLLLVRWTLWRWISRHPPQISRRLLR